MIWLDIIDPKYVLFFRDFIPLIKREFGMDALVTSRESKGYDECAKLLRLFKIDYVDIGEYGGADIAGKFRARLERQMKFLELFGEIGFPKLFICGASADGVQIAFGLGIPVVHFADTPLSSNRLDYDSITILSKLTTPLSTLIFRPFVVPEEAYTIQGISPKNVVPYDFIDVALWLKDMKRKEGNDFRKKFGLDLKIATILIREEEYKAHYVKDRLSVIYDSILELSENIEANIVIMPRYESGYLKERFGNLKNIHIIEEKLEPKEFYPSIDILDRKSVV